MASLMFHPCQCGMPANKFVGRVLNEEIGRVCFSWMLEHSEVPCPQAFLCPELAYSKVCDLTEAMPSANPQCSGSIRFDDQFPLEPKV